MNEKSLVDIAFEMDIAAPIDVVWRNMTSTQTVPGWLGCMRYDKAIGHIFYMQQDPDKRVADNIEGATHCEILELSEPSKFVFSWYFPDMPKTFVTISLQETSPAQTLVSFVHSGWDQFNAREIRSIRDALAEGWNSHVLPNLKDLIENQS